MVILALLIRWLILLVCCACYLFLLVAFLRGSRMFEPVRPPKFLQVSRGFAIRFFVAGMAIAAAVAAFALLLESQLVAARATAASQYSEAVSKLQAEADAIEVAAAGIHARYRAQTSFPSQLSLILRSLGNGLTLGLTSAKQVELQMGLNGVGLHWAGGGVWEESQQYERNMVALAQVSAELATRMRQLVRQFREKTTAFVERQRTLDGLIAKLEPWANHYLLTFVVATVGGLLVAGFKREAAEIVQKGSEDETVAQT